MKRGFTLIELLAIIGILGIIAIITAPIINNTLITSREKAFKKSVEELLNISKMDYNEYGRLGTITYTYSNDKLICKQCNNGTDLELDFDGKLTASGNIVNNNGNITLNISNTKFTATYNNGVKVVKK